MADVRKHVKQKDADRMGMIHSTSYRNKEAPKATQGCLSHADFCFSYRV